MVETYLTFPVCISIMSSVEYSQDVYSSVESIARNCLDISEEEMESLIQEEFDIDFYSLETDSIYQTNADSVNKYMRAGFNISSLLADEYSGSDDVFFQERSDDFREFSQELGRFGNGFNSKHFIQYVNLYSEIAIEEDLNPEVSTSEVVLQNFEEKRQTVREFLSEVEREFSNKLEA